ncbi:MAG TPA: oxygenase MpaB family protein [Actinocrinis sp.]|nr:oxygenase MpaB family protein [Actinocrinis sp.]
MAGGGVSGAVRRRVKAKILETVHDGDLRLERFREPAGDVGLFGPGSMAWRVHAHPAGMLTGGFGALMLQSLHPLAMAGVAEYSDYREDPLGRLSKTARYVTMTSFGPTHEAEAAIARVRRAHSYIHGTTADGRTYRADDPDLLTWVHTAEVSCFLAGYQAFSGNPLTSEECDRYFAEVAVLAERLGARDVPHSVADATSYIARMRSELTATPAALEAVGFLRGFGRDALERLVTKVLMNGGVGLLPGWARAQLGIRRPRAVRTLLDRPAARLLGDFMIWACGPSEFVVESRARIERAEPSSAGIYDQLAL